jgi:hypothetical protein
MKRQTEAPIVRYTTQEQDVMRKITGAPKAVRRRICGALRALIEQAPAERDAGRKSPAAPAGTVRAGTKDARK